MLGWCNIPIFSSLLYIQVVVVSTIYMCASHEDWGVSRYGFIKLNEKWHCITCHSKAPDLPPSSFLPSLCDVFVCPLFFTFILRSHTMWHLPVTSTSFVRDQKRQKVEGWVLLLVPQDTVSHSHLSLRWGTFTFLTESSMTTSSWYCLSVRLNKLKSGSENMKTSLTRMYEIKIRKHGAGVNSEHRVVGRSRTCQAPRSTGPGLVISSRGYCCQCANILIFLYQCDCLLCIVCVPVHEELRVRSVTACSRENKRVSSSAVLPFTWP